MNKTLLERYKNLYKDNSELTINDNGKIHIPIWLIMLLMHRSGIKSRKKRIMKKVLKREVMKLLETQLKNNQE